MKSYIKAEAERPKQEEEAPQTERIMYFRIRSSELGGPLATSPMVSIWWDILFNKTEYRIPIYKMGLLLWLMQACVAQKPGLSQTLAAEGLKNNSKRNTCSLPFLHHGHSPGRVSNLEKPGPEPREDRIKA